MHDRSHFKSCDVPPLAPRYNGRFALNITASVIRPVLTPHSTCSSAGKSALPAGVVHCGGRADGAGRAAAPAGVGSRGRGGGRGGRAGVRGQQVALHVALGVEHLLTDGAGGLAPVHRPVAAQRRLRVEHPVADVAPDLRRRQQGTCNTRPRR